MNAANDFEKDFFKLMINSVYGKTMENFWKRITVWLVTNEKDFLKYIRKTTHIAHKFAAIHDKKQVLMLNKLIYVGFTVLELSRWLMYGFHYNFIKEKYWYWVVIYWHRQSCLWGKIRRYLRKIF